MTHCSWSLALFRRASQIPVNVTALPVEPIPMELTLVGAAHSPADDDRFRVGDQVVL
jgi:hypothetical protein